MTNPLQAGMMPPEAPAVQPNAIQGNSPISQPQAAQSTQATVQAPAPTHAQTVAALRHLAAVKDELLVLMKDPDIGKADMKSAIIDGVTKLVADRIVPPSAAVQKLAMVPDTPFLQKKWILQDYAQTMQAENFVLSHHAAAFAGQGAQPPGDPDNHMQDIKSMMASHYSGQGQQ
jgi:hypothetical protein